MVEPVVLQAVGSVVKTCVVKILEVSTTAVSTASSTLINFVPRNFLLVRLLDFKL